VGVVQGKLGALYTCTGAASVAFTTEATTKNAGYTRYKITNQAKRFWDAANGVTVKKNGATITTGFTVEYAGGEIVFDPALISTDTITVTGKYFAMEQQAGIFEWKLDTSADMKDVTTFASDGWEESVPVKNNYSVSAKGFWANSNYLSRLGGLLAVALFVDTVSNKRYEGYISISKDSITQPTNDVVQEDVELKGSGQIYYHE
jgi:hypothetical protein